MHDKKHDKNRPIEIKKCCAYPNPLYQLAKMLDMHDVEVYRHLPFPWL